MHNGRTSFIATDLELIQQTYVVQELHLTVLRFNPLRILRGVLWADFVFCWFASWHSLLPVLLARLLGRPSITVVGGYDTANIPAIGYGNQRGGLRRLVSRWTMHLSTWLIANSYYAASEVSLIGIPRSKVHVVYHGFDERWIRYNGRKQPLVITVGNVNMSNMLRKGLMPFVETARILPNIDFAVIGEWQDQAVHELRKVAPRNVQFLGFLSRDQLAEYYKRAKVYVQASSHEAFGLSVAEAMLAGCVPVVTKAGALPEVVGDCGILVESVSPVRLAEAVSQALMMPAEATLRCRQHVLTAFPMEKRRRAISEVIDKTLERGPSI